MSDQKKILHDDSNGLDYVLVEDYYLPMIDLPKETRPIGYWGMLRKEYLKNYKSGMYSYLLLTGKLDGYVHGDHLLVRMFTSALWGNVHDRTFQ